MSKSVLSWSLAVVLLSGLVYWIASNTEWVDVTLPMPPTGEAAENPFYAAERFTNALGAHSVRDRQLAIPSRDAVVVLSAWHWDLTERRRYALERWVESGGRLVVAGPLTGGADEFERWSGVARKERPPAPAVDADERCRPVHEQYVTVPKGAPPARLRMLCDIDVASVLEATGKPVWGLGDATGTQVVRVRVGNGSVTVLNATPFQFRQLLDADHGWLFVAATELRRTDEVHFLTEDDHPSLLNLTWRNGAPAIVLVLAAIGLALWRGSTRFGPLAEPRQSARRSLAEQIRGTGQFALRYGDGESLHEAAVRALTEAAARRVPGYLHLSPGERAEALARLTGFELNAFTAAVHHAGLRSVGELRGTLSFLETARREVLRSDPWNSSRRRN